MKCHEHDQCDCVVIARQDIVRLPAEDQLMLQGLLARLEVLQARRARAQDDGPFYAEQENAQ